MNIQYVNNKLETMLKRQSDSDRTNVLMYRKCEDALFKQVDELSKRIKTLEDHLHIRYEQEPEISQDEQDKLMGQYPLPLDECGITNMMESHND